MSTGLSSLFHLSLSLTCGKGQSSSLCLSAAAKLCTLFSLDLSHLCPGASQHESTRHTQTSPSGANTLHRIRPPAPGTTSPSSDPPAWRLPAGLLHLARRIVARWGALPGHTRRAAFLPTGSYADAAPSPLAAGRRRKIHTQNRSLEHRISGCRR